MFWTWDTSEQAEFFNAVQQDGIIEKALAPTNRPDPCSETTSGAGLPGNSPTANLALYVPVNASASLPDYPPEYAVDGAVETEWGSGVPPEQWIELDLGQPRTISGIRLIVAQYADGPTTHQVWVRGASGELELVDEFKGDTTNMQALEASFEPALENIQYVRIVTTQNLYWVAWREIEVLGW